MLELSVVIPTYRGGPEGVIDQLRGLYPPESTEIIVVDDGSGERHQDGLRDSLASLSGVTVIALPRRKGQANATLVGVAAASGRIVVTMDDDGEHPVKMVPVLVDAVRSGNDLVYGAPRWGLSGAGNGSKAETNLGYTSALRRLGTLLNNGLFSLSLGKPWHVPVTSFRAVHRSLLQRALRRPVRFGYLSAMLYAQKPTTAARFYLRSKVSPTRYRVLALLRAYLQIALHWGPLRPFSPLTGRPKITYRAEDAPVAS